jgi:hypothetical protein
MTQEVNYSCTKESVSHDTADTDSEYGEVLQWNLPSSLPRTPYANVYSFSPVHMQPIMACYVPISQFAGIQLPNQSPAPSPTSLTPLSRPLGALGAVGPEPERQTGRDKAKRAEKKKAEKQKAEKDKAEKDKAEKDKSETKKAEKKNAEKKNAEKQKAAKTAPQNVMQQVNVGAGNCSAALRHALARSEANLARVDADLAYFIGQLRASE